MKNYEAHKLNYFWRVLKFSYHYSSSTLYGTLERRLDSKWTLLIKFRLHQFTLFRFLNPLRWYAMTDLTFAVHGYMVKNDQKSKYVVVCKNSPIIFTRTYIA